MSENKSLPFVTLTFATSLDSALSLAPGTQTALSGPQSKAMTHYLRSKHDAILVGVGTAIADNPSLNCRLAGVGGYGGEKLYGQPRAIVVDPRGRWKLDDNTKILQLAKAGRGKAPWVVTAHPLEQASANVLEAAGGSQIRLETESRDFDWEIILQTIGKKGIKSVMIEGGGVVINSLLSSKNSHLVNAVIVTIAPTWLGQGGVVVSPKRPQEQMTQPVPIARLEGPQWQQLGDDVVLCGRFKP